MAPGPFLLLQIQIVGSKYDMPKRLLWHEDDSELTTSEKQQMGVYGGALCPPPFYLKARHKFPFIKVPGNS
jgi:hypothetical protein